MKYFSFTFLFFLIGHVTQAQVPGDAYLLRQLYGNVRETADGHVANYKRNQKKHPDACGELGVLQFSVTAKEAYTSNGVPALLVFTAAKRSNGSDCPVATGVGYFKKKGSTWKLVDARKYLVDVGQSGQGGFNEIVRISDQDMAGLAYTETVSGNTESTTMRVVGIQNDQITDFTSAAPVLVSERTRTNGVVSPLWSGTPSFVKGEDAVYMLILDVRMSGPGGTEAGREIRHLHYEQGTFLGR